MVGGVNDRPSNIGAVSMEVNMEGTVNSKRLGEGQGSWTHYEQGDVGAKIWNVASIRRSHIPRWPICGILS